MAQKGPSDQAVQAYRKALEQTPKSTSVLNNLGLQYLLLGRLEQAESAFTEGLKLDPDHFNLNRNMTTLRLRQKRYDAALEHARKAHKLQPDNRWVYADLARAWAGKGERDEARPGRQGRLQGNRQAQAGAGVRKPRPTELALVPVAKHPFLHLTPYATTRLRETKHHARQAPSPPPHRTRRYPNTRRSSFLPRLPFAGSARSYVTQGTKRCPEQAPRLRIA